MRKKMLTILAAFGAAVAVFVPSPVMSASDTPCIGGLTMGTFDNVVVPAGGTCLLTFSTVHGNVTALENSFLIYAQNRIGGNVVGDNAEIVRSEGQNMIHGDVQVWGGDVDQTQADVGLDRDTVHGDVWVEKMRAGDISIGLNDVHGNIQVNQNHVTGLFNDLRDNLVPNGNIQVTENVVPGRLRLDDNSVGSDLQVSKNTGPGAKLVQNNTVRENLQCFDNAPMFVGSPNVAGKAEGQCS